jgi:2-dehydropantoate 2-reductase
MTAIALVGPGSVGTYIAAQLAAAGHDVLACARRPFTEYVVESPEHPVTHEARVATDPADIPAGWSPRFVLVCVKAHQTPGAADWLARLAGPDTTLVAVQNGVEGRERLTPYAAGGEAVPSVVYCGAELLAPGHVRHYTAGLLITPDTASMHELAAAAEGTGLKVRPDPAYVTETWRKLGANICANGITALTRRRIEVLAEPMIADLVRGLLGECWAVARAEGATLGDADIDTFVGAVGARPGRGGTSMYYDRMAGRPTEHDALYGAVVRAGARHGIATPLVGAVQALIAAGDAPPLIAAEG